MLEALREGTRGWIAWVIIGILTVPFALWGIGNYAGIGTSQDIVAEVNGVNITQTALSKAYQRRLTQLQRQFGRDYMPKDPASLKKTVLDDVINHRLLKLHSRDAGYRVSNKQLLLRIHAMPVFNVGGKFNLNIYRIRLQRSGYTPQAFESSVRQDMAVRQLRLAIAASATATGPELDRFVALSHEQRKIGYATVAADQYLGKAQPTEAEIKAWYQSHKKKFRTPEKVSIAYIQLSAQDLAKTIHVSEKDLRAFYQKKKGGLVTQGQRRVAHILIAPKSDKAQADKAAKVKAESILKKLHGGASFAALAEKYSDDPGSASKGGELGWIQHGEMVKPFEKAVFNAKKAGAIVGPVKTKFGYHIIKIEGIRQAHQKSFKEVRNQLAQEYKSKKAEDKYYKLGGQLSNLAFDHTDSLEPIHKALQLPIEHVKNVTRKAGKDIAGNKKIRDAAFSTEVLKNGKNHIVRLGKTHVVVIRDANRQASSIKPLKAVKPQIVKILKQQAASEKAAQVAKSIAAKVEAGASLKTAAKSFKVQPATFVKRDADSVPKSILKAAFGVDVKPGAANVHAGTVALKSGNQAIYVVSGAKLGDPSSITDTQKKQLVGTLVTGHAKAELAAYVSDLRKRADVTVNENNIRTY